jgi:electron-transferring-flavoprotein dehydrogenase
MTVETFERETMKVDVLIIGAGPAGLSASIRLMQLAKEKSCQLSVCVLEKSSEVGGHILSGAIFDPIALEELIPDWRDKNSPLNTPITKSNHSILTKTSHISIPHFLMPPMLSNKGCFTLSLGNLCRWLAKEAEELGVEIYPGFAGSEILFNENQSVKGVATGNVGVTETGEKGSNFELGMELHAKYTFFAEGVRGSLTKEILAKFSLGENCEPQTYAIGIKELWDIQPRNHKIGEVMHTQGWPLEKTVGGGFVYHQEKNQLSIGLVIALDYDNPFLSPYEEMQRFKTHPKIKPLLKGGQRVAYGARAINEGGLQSIPKLIFPGGALIGCSAGFVNVPRIKGSHTAMKTGILAAESAFEVLSQGGQGGDELSSYPISLSNSWVHKELKKVRNIRPALSKFGVFLGTIYSGLEMWIQTLGFGFFVRWTFGHKEDHLSLKKAEECTPIEYPKSDGEVTFDRLANVSFSGVSHTENQPIHLQIKDQTIPVLQNYNKYAGPEQRFCPAGVYEFLENNGEMELQINAQNCIHCKTCDIKDLNQNIIWKPPEGGGGPNYPNM